MTTAYTSLLGLALPVTGELSGTWGDTVNNSITSLLDSAIAGTTTLSTDADVTLTTTSGAANTAREAILLCSGARTGIKTVTAPAQSKIYTIINATTGGYAVKIVGAGPTTGLTIPNGSSAVIAWNGSDFIEIGSGTIGNLTVNGNLTVTGTTTLTGVATLTANPVLSAGTANGVMYANGSKVLTTGSALTFDGTSLGLGTASPGVKFDIVSGNNTSLASVLRVNSNNVAVNTSLAYDGLIGSGQLTVQAGAASALIFGASAAEQMRLTSTGLGIGTSSPATKLDIGANDSTAKTISLRYSSIPSYYSSTFDGSVGLNTISINTYNTSSGSTSWSAFNNTSYGAAAIQLASQNGSGNFIRFLVSTAANTVPVETARIDSSGNLLVGTTSSTLLADSGGFIVYPTSIGETYYAVKHDTGTASGATYAAFTYATSIIGSITQSGTTAVLYNVTSDQRLKQNIQDADDSASLVDALQVRKFDWKADGNHQRYGFIAQELVTVAPEAVHQPANPDDMMAVDYSKLVPMLVKEIQSLRKRLATAGI